MLREAERSSVRVDGETKEIREEQEVQVLRFQTLDYWPGESSRRAAETRLVGPPVQAHLPELRGRQSASGVRVRDSIEEPILGPLLRRRSLRV